MGDKLKVAVLYDVWGEEDAPEADAADTGRKRKEKEDREEIFDALGKLGHEAFYHVLDGRPQSLYGLGKCGADLIFNLTESYAGADTKEMNVAAYMDLLGLTYTGAGPHAHFRSAVAGPCAADRIGRALHGAVSGSQFVRALRGDDHFAARDRGGRFE